MRTIIAQKTDQSQADSGQILKILRFDTIQQFWITTILQGNQECRKEFHEFLASS